MNKQKCIVYDQQKVDPLQFCLFYSQDFLFGDCPGAGGGGGKRTPPVQLQLEEELFIRMRSCYHKDIMNMHKESSGKFIAFLSRLHIVLIFFLLASVKFSSYFAARLLSFSR